MNASKAVNGLDCVKEALLNVKDNEKLIEHVEYAQRAIEEQDERISIMQESDNVGGLFLELLEKWADDEEKLISEFCGGEDREQEEKELLADGIQEYLKRAADCGFMSVPVYNIAEGHARTGLEKATEGYIAMWYTAEDYAEPGSQPNVTGKEVPVFGYRIRDARHAELMAETFKIIAEMIKKGVGESALQTPGGVN